MKKTYLTNLGLILLVATVATTGCTKLKENEISKINVGGSSGSISAASQLIAAYNDLNTPFHGQDEVFSLQENTTDECLVPTRAGDWDDNGVWRLLHTHTWDATHGQVSQVFTNLGTLESDATTTLALSPSTEQAAEAIFLRSLAQYYFLNLYGQVPYRTIANYNTIGVAPVMKPADAVDTLVNDLSGIISQLNPNNTHDIATPNAARFLLMKVLLNKQWFLNPAKPATQAAADMEQVRTLGLAIESSSQPMPGPHGTIALNANYFDNFGPNNGGFGASGTGGASDENIFVYGNNGTANNPNGTGNGGIDDRWMMALHYNSWDQNNTYGNAGWNGFSTIAEVYTAFDPTDTRKGNVSYPIGTAGHSPISGLNVGLDSGQQYNEKGQEITDRRGNLLSFLEPVANVETDVHTLEGAGIRGIKYYPDYANYTGHASNQLAIFRYADVELMIAEADLSGASGGATEALTKVNALHAKRGAAPLSALTLVNSSNLYDGTTMLEERQKELWWESWRREDMIRMGVFLQSWDLKSADAGTTYLLFPIPVTQLVANPNLKQNPGY